MVSQDQDDNSFTADKKVHIPWSDFTRAHHFMRNQIGTTCPPANIPRFMECISHFIVSGSKKFFAQFRMPRKAGGRKNLVQGEL